MYIEKQTSKYASVGYFDNELIHNWVRRKPPHQRRFYWLLAKQFQSFTIKPLSEVNLEDIQAFVSAQTLQKIPPRQIAKNLAVIKSLMTFGYQTGCLPMNISPMEWQQLKLVKLAIKKQKQYKIRLPLTLSVWFLSAAIPLSILNQFQPSQRVFNLVRSWNTPAIPSANEVYGQSEYLKNPNIKAFLDTISQAEGTSGPDGYRTIFAGETFSDYSKHPDEVKCAYSNGQRLCSSAAGKYQFLKPTFDRLQKKLNLPDFSPQSQDLAAIELIREEGALEDIKAGKIKEALEKVSAIWVHIEGAGYGQPEHSFEKLEGIYQKHRQKYE